MNWKLLGKTKSAKIYQLTGTNEEKGYLLETDAFKLFRSETYNYNFSKITGFFQRWGATKEDNPTFSPFGPEIIDIEVSTICHGINKEDLISSTSTTKVGPCNFCYKTNNSNGLNMSLTTFKKLSSKFSPFVNQIAFGIGSIDANKALFDIMRHTRSLGIIPNITINGSRMTDSLFEQLAMVCGACAISNYDKELCYSTVDRLNQEKKKPGTTLQSVNIHQLLSEETYNTCLEVMQDYLVDPRLSELGAIVLLSLKPKGNRNTLHQLESSKKYQALIDFAISNNVPLGFDSCGCHRFLSAVKDSEQYQEVAEPCESTCFSFYVNAECQSVPCSFCEGEADIKPINLLETSMEDAWNSEQVIQFRKKLLKNNRNCPVFDLKT